MLGLKFQCWRLFGGPGRFLDASWASYGCSWALLEHFGTISARFGEDFAVILAGFGHPKWPHGLVNFLKVGYLPMDIYGTCPPIMGKGKEGVNPSPELKIGG